MRGGEIKNNEVILEQVEYDNLVEYPGGDVQCPIGYTALEFTGEIKDSNVNWGGHSHKGENQSPGIHCSHPERTYLALIVCCFLLVTSIIWLRQNLLEIFFLNQFHLHLKCSRTI